MANVPLFVEYQNIWSPYNVLWFLVASACGLAMTEAEFRRRASLLETLRMSWKMIWAISTETPKTSFGILKCAESHRRVKSEYYVNSITERRRKHVCRLWAGHDSCAWATLWRNQALNFHRKTGEISPGKPYPGPRWNQQRGRYSGYKLPRFQPKCPP